MNGLTFLLRCIVIVLLMTDTVLAKSLRDERSGMIIDPPSGWGVEGVLGFTLFYRLFPILTEADLNDAELMAEGEAGTLAVCRVQASSGDFQANLNVPVREPAFLDRAKADMEKTFDNVSVERFVKGAMIGVIVIGDEKARPDRRGMQVFLTTPKSMADLFCGAQRTRFDRLRGQFDGIVRGITLPE